MLALIFFSCIIVFIVGTDTEGKHSNRGRRLPTKINEIMLDRPDQFAIIDASKQRSLSNETYLLPVITLDHKRARSGIGGGLSPADFSNGRAAPARSRLNANSSHLRSEMRMFLIPWEMRTFLIRNTVVKKL